MNEKILILTPLKNAESFLDGYFELLSRLTYSHDRISLGFLEGDSTDRTWPMLCDRLPTLQQEFRSASVWQKAFGVFIPPHLPRDTPSIQLERREVLAKCRNHLLFRALNDEDWVLWIDADIVEYPPDIIEQLMAAKKDIVVPHCVQQADGSSFDRNAWRDKGRLHIHDLKAEGDLVPLHAVGGTLLLVKADAHRDGLIFPPFLYGRHSRLIRADNLFVSDQSVWRRRILHPLRSWLATKGVADGSVGEIETEGLGIMAHDMGYSCWAMPHLEVRHAIY